MSNVYLQIGVYLKKCSLPYFDHKMKPLAITTGKMFFGRIGFFCFITLTFSKF